MSFPEKLMRDRASSYDFLLQDLLSLCHERTPTLNDVRSLVGDGAYKRLGKSSLPRRFAPASLRPDATPLMNRDQRKKSVRTSLHD
jgi:hypothetical protein